MVGEASRQPRAERRVELAAKTIPAGVMLQGGVGGPCSGTLLLSTISVLWGLLMLYKLSRIALLWAVVLPQFAYATPLETEQQRFPNVEAVQVRSSGPDRFDFDVTISSRYDTPKRYADAFRAIGKDGRVFGERVLLHAHADEQPFTRDLHGVKIPAEVRTIVIQARDQKFGYGGNAVEVSLPGR